MHTACAGLNAHVAMFTPQRRHCGAGSPNADGDSRTEMTPRGGWLKEGGSIATQGHLRVCVDFVGSLPGQLRVKIGGLEWIDILI